MILDWFQNLLLLDCDRVLLQCLEALKYLESIPEHVSFNVYLLIALCAFDYLFVHKRTKSPTNDHI